MLGTAGVRPGRLAPTSRPGHLFFYVPITTLICEQGRVGSDDSHTTGKVKTEPRPSGAFFHSPRSFISASSSPGEPIALIRIALCERNEERSSPSAPLTRRAGLFFCVASSRPGGVDLIHGIPGHLGGIDARPEPTRPPVKCAFCDRHHIASAMAELSSYLWIVPHMRSFFVPPKYSAPLTRGLFCDLDFLRTILDEGR